MNKKIKKIKSNLNIPNTKEIEVFNKTKVIIYRILSHIISNKYLLNNF